MLTAPYSLSGEDPSTPATPTHSFFADSCLWAYILIFSHQLECSHFSLGLNNSPFPINTPADYSFIWIFKHPSQIFVSSCPLDLKSWGTQNQPPSSVLLPPLLLRILSSEQLVASILHRESKFRGEQLSFSKMKSQAVWHLTMPASRKENIFGGDIWSPHILEIQGRVNVDQVLGLLTDKLSMAVICALSHKEFICKMLMVSALAGGQLQEVWFTSRQGPCILHIPRVMQFWTQIDSRSLVFQEGQCSEMVAQSPPGSPLPATPVSLEGLNSQSRS